MRIIRCFILFLMTAAVVAAALPQDVYVWQRAWTPPVTNALAKHAAHFGGTIVLQAEVTWHRGSPTYTPVDLDYTALRNTGERIGLALRIGTFPGPFTVDAPQTVYLAELCRTLIAEAAAHQLQPAELQLDFDCAESKLDGYRVWLQKIRDAVHPVPVVITALPSWLNQPAFERLIHTADGYVLQVHSFERPKNPDAKFTLCDPLAAKRAVTKAAALGKPFRVALPTYGYLLAFDPGGRFLGLSAEGPNPNWPGDAVLKEVRADAVELSRLVNGWTTNRPVELTGLIWYRLPVDSDVMNWPWPTLESVMAGRAPTARVRVNTRTVRMGLVELDLVNKGSADATGRYTVNVRWSEARRMAADGVWGYAITQIQSHSLTMEPPHSPGLLKPDERRTIGWIRFNADPVLETELNEVDD